MSGQLPIDIIVRMESALKDVERFRKDSTRAVLDVEGAFSKADPIIQRTMGSILTFNATRAIMGGVATSVGLATKGFIEWSKRSDEAADSLNRLKDSWGGLLERIGQDVDESGAVRVLNKTLKRAGTEWDRYQSRVNEDGDFGRTIRRSMFSIESPEDRRQAELRYQNLVETRILASETADRPRVTKLRDAERVNSMRSRGDELGVANAEYQAEMQRIAGLRGGIRPGAANGRELRELYTQQEETARNKLIAVQDRILKGQMAEEEFARRTAEQIEAKAEAELKAEAAKVRAGKQTEQDYEFTMRAMVIENQRNAGDEEGARIAEERLKFDRQRYALANDPNLSTIARNSLIRRTDTLEAEALSAISGSTTTRARQTYQAPGMLTSGLAGVAGLGAQAFAQGPGQNVAVQSLTTLKSIDRTLKAGGGGARFN